jgi:hypothetical protein
MIIVVRHCPAVVSYVNFARWDAVALNDNILGCLRNSDNLVSPNETFIFNLVNQWIAAVSATAVKLGCVNMGDEWNTEVLLCEDGSYKLIRRAETPKDYFATLDCFDILDNMNYNLPKEV